MVFATSSCSREIPVLLANPNDGPGRKELFQSHRMASLIIFPIGIKPFLGRIIVHTFFRALV